MENLERLNVSVLMLTYNRENLVSRAIESVLNQTHRNFEFIIVDNGSTDKSGQIADEYAQKDSRIRVIHREKGTISAGRNTALDAAQGDYIAFIDDDDWVEPDFLAFLLSLIAENDAQIAICGTPQKMFDETLVMDTEQALIELMWRKRYNVGFPTKMIHRSLLASRRFPSEIRFDDISLMYQIVADAKTVAYHGLPKYHVYRHDGNNSSWTTHHELLTPEILQEYLTAYRVRTDWLSNRFPGSAHAFRYFEWSFMISMVEKIERLHLTACECLCFQMKDTLSSNFKEFYNSVHLQPYEKEWMDVYIKGEKTMDVNILDTLKWIPFAINTVCNLRCKDCNAYTPYHKHPRNFDTAQLKKDLDRILEVFDGTPLERIDFVGGEPLLHPDLKELIDYAMDGHNGKAFQSLHLVTNGVLPLPDDLIETCKKYNVYILVDDYGPDLSPNAHLNCDKLEAAGIAHRMNKYWGDDQYFGGWWSTVMSKEPNSPEYVASCVKECWELFIPNHTHEEPPCNHLHIKDGNIMTCDAQTFGLNYIPLLEGEYISLRTDESVEQIREKLRSFKKKPIEHCKYCEIGIASKKHAKRIPAGVQLTSEESKQLGKFAGDY